MSASLRSRPGRGCGHFGVDDQLEFRCLHDRKEWDFQEPDIRSASAVPGRPCQSHRPGCAQSIDFPRPSGCCKTVAREIRRGYAGDAQIPLFLCSQFFDPTGSSSNLPPTSILPMGAMRRARQHTAMTGDYGQAVSNMRARRKQVLSIDRNAGSRRHVVTVRTIVAVVQDPAFESR